LKADLLFFSLHCPFIYLNGGSEEGDPLYEGGERDLWLGGQGEEDTRGIVPWFTWRVEVRRKIPSMRVARETSGLAVRERRILVVLSLDLPEGWEW
jgi:hypothetical protein